MPEILHLEYIRDTLKRWCGVIKTLLRDACREVGRRGEPNEVKAGDFLKVRNRAGEACADCGTIIRRPACEVSTPSFVPNASRCRESRSSIG